MQRSHVIGKRIDQARRKAIKPPTPTAAVVEPNPAEALRMVNHARDLIFRACDIFDALPNGVMGQHQDAKQRIRFLDLVGILEEIRDELEARDFVERFPNPLEAAGAPAVASVSPIARVGMEVEADDPGRDNGIERGIIRHVCTLCAVVEMPSGSLVAIRWPEVCLVGAGPDLAAVA